MSRVGFLFFWFGCCFVFFFKYYSEALLESQQYCQMEDHQGYLFLKIILHSSAVMYNTLFLQRTYSQNILFSQSFFSSFLNKNSLLKGVLVPFIGCSYICYLINFLFSFPNTISSYCYLTVYLHASLPVWIKTLQFYYHFED